MLTVLLTCLPSHIQGTLCLKNHMPVTLFQQLRQRLRGYQRYAVFCLFHIFLYHLPCAFCAHGNPCLATQPVARFCCGEFTPFSQQVYMDRFIVINGSLC